MAVTEFFCDKSFARPGPTVLVRITRVDPGGPELSVIRLSLPTSSLFRMWKRLEGETTGMNLHNSDTSFMIYAYNLSLYKDTPDEKKMLVLHSLDNSLD